MGKYRSRLQIIADILSVVRGGARKTRVMYQANLSYKLLSRYLGEVLEAGLVRFGNDDCYELTQNGKEFLDRFNEYSERHRSVKERLNAVINEKVILENTFCNAKAVKANRLRSRRTRVRKGVILAAGEGTRMRKVTYGAFPKELLPIGNVPTIRFPMEALRLVGIKDILVVIAPQTKHGIIDGLQSGERFGVNISYIVQEKNENGVIGLGPAISTAQGWIGRAEDFVVACGDSIICDFASNNPLDCLKPLIKFHKLTDAIATILVYPVRFDPTRFGVVKFKRLNSEDGVLCGELERLVEKPSLEIAEAYKLNGYHYIVAGYYAFKPKIFSYIEKTKPGARNEVQITDAMMLALENGEKVCAVVHAGNKGDDVFPCDYWDVGIPEEYKEANKRLLDANLEQLMGSGGHK